MKQKQVDFIFKYKNNLYPMTITENPSGLFFFSTFTIVRTPPESVEELLRPEVIKAIYNQLNKSNLTDEDGNLK